MDYPSWLPAMINIDGEWSSKVIDLYNIFRKDFVTDRPIFSNLPIRWDDRKLDGGKYEEGFWHLVTREDQSNNNRLPDFRRAERLSWCAAVIRNHKDPAITSFCYDHGRRNRHGELLIRTYLWLMKLNYVVILEERKRQKCFFLNSAFHVDKFGEYSLKKKFEKRIIP